MRLSVQLHRKIGGLNKMMKRKKRILIGGSIVLIAAICGAIFLFNGKTQPTKSLAKQVEEDYTGIEEIIYNGLIN